MNTAKKAAGLDIKVNLFTLWIVVMFNSEVKNFEG